VLGIVKRVEPVLPLKARKPRLFSAFYATEKMLKSQVQALCHLLKDLGVNLFKSGDFLFQRRKFGNLLMIADGETSPLVSEATLFQHAIV
jgi:hypothetical protein